MSFYFRPLPRINYANTASVDMFARPALSPIAEKAVAVYYPYTLKDGERADHVARHYYEDSSLSWLLYFTNNISDPYYQWYLSDTEFNEFIVAKYGSIEAAQQKVEYYFVSYHNNESFLSSTAYEALAVGQKKYWKPVLSENNVIRGYERKAVDWIAETNMVQTCVFSANGTPVVNERVTQTNANSVVVAVGTIAHVNETDLSITFKHISGAFDTALQVVGDDFTLDLDSVGEITYSIPLAEQVYWEPKYSYEVEEELNEARRTIYIMDREYLPQIERELEGLF